jgi:prevent-host-death family protein
VSVSQLKARLSTYMEKVKGGTTLIVTERGGRR